MTSESKGHFAPERPIPILLILYKFFKKTFNSLFRNFLLNVPFTSKSWQGPCPEVSLTKTIT